MQATTHHNLNKVRVLLWDGFTTEELRDFCFYEPAFRDLYEELPEGEGKKREIIRRILDFAVKRGKIEVILKWAEETNHSIYEKCAPYYNDLSLHPVIPSGKDGVQQPAIDHIEFDVFLAHNSQDKLQVEAIAGELKRRGLKPWLDKEQIPPGRWFQDVIQKAIPTCKSAAIFLSPKGLGKWEAVELRAFISQCVEADLPVIPVLLSSVDDIPQGLLFLKELNWVRFTSIDDAEALDRLEWGITGKRPRRISGET